MKEVLAFIMVCLVMPSAILGYSCDPADPAGYVKRGKYEIWASKYLSEQEMLESIHVRTGRAMKRMFRMATLHEGDVGPLFELDKRILEDPNRPLWAHCGSVARLYKDILENYGYTVELVSVWEQSAPNPHNEHILVRFAGPGVEEFTYYDPLYGVAIVNDSGEWVGFRDIFHDLSGSNQSSLTVYNLEPYEPAASAGYQNMNQYDYATHIYPRYFSAVVFRPVNASQSVVHVFDTNKVDPGLVTSTFPNRTITVMTLY